MTSINPAKWRRFFEEQAAQGSDQPAVVDINVNGFINVKINRLSSILTLIKPFPTGN